jgi:hypothetical protein
MKLQTLTWDQLPAWHKASQEKYEELLLPSEVYPTDEFGITPEQSCQMAELLDSKPIVITQWKDGKPLLAYPSFIMYTVEDCLDYHCALNTVTDGKKPTRTKKPKFSFSAK